MILPENEFSLLKGVNNQPYLDIWTSASHLTKRFLFSCISLLFLLSFVFYIHPIVHFRAFCLCVKTSLNAKPFIWFAPAYRFISWQSNSFLYERFHTETRFETEAQGYIHPWAAHRSLSLSTLFDAAMNNVAWVPCLNRGLVVWSQILFFITAFFALSS